MLIEYTAVAEFCCCPSFPAALFETEGCHYCFIPLTSYKGSTERSGYSFLSSPRDQPAVQTSPNLFPQLSITNFPAHFTSILTSDLLFQYLYIKNQAPPALQAPRQPLKKQMTNTCPMIRQEQERHLKQIAIQLSNSFTKILLRPPVSHLSL